MKIPRIETLDVLRGFALLGIFLTHIYSVNMMEYAHSDKTHALINIVYLNVLFGKFYTIFSFLFGLGFYIQFQNSQSRSANFRRIYFRRLMILFLIGSLHFLLYAGDILQVYSMLGLMLLLFRKSGSGTILALGCMFILLSIIVPAWNLGDAFIGKANALLPFLGNKLIDKYNWYLFIEGQLFVIAAFFFFGFYAGKIRLFQDIDTSGFKKLQRYSFISAVALTAVLAFIYFSGARKNPGFANVDLIVAVSTRLQQVSLTALYVSTIVILHKSVSWKFLRHLMPIGRIGLTVYITQSFIIYFLYDHLSSIGIVAALLTGTATFVMLCLLSKAWLRYFSSGPVEWIWRKATNFKRKPAPRRPSKQKAPTNTVRAPLHEYSTGDHQ